jgi:hypothetical protein
VKAAFDAAIKVVIKPLIKQREKKKKKKTQRGCSIFTAINRHNSHADHFTIAGHVA